MNTNLPIDTKPSYLANDMRTVDRFLLRRERCDWALRWIRSCPACGSVWPPIDTLCLSCWEKLFKIVNSCDTARDLNYPFPVYSLFTWKPENDFLLRPLISGMKGGLAVGACSHLIEYFEQARVLYHNDNQLLFVYPPSAHGGRDHAWLLAQLLARKHQTGPAKTFDRKLSQGVRKERVAQKARSAVSRSEIRYQPMENFTRPGRPVVFVDDVITTGSTAMAAYLALGDPNDFAVWTLVSRPKLAGKSRI